MPTAHTPAPRRRGRPPVAADPAHRAKHIRCLMFKYVYEYSAEEIARILDCSARSVSGWCRLALSYDDPRVAAVRRCFLPGSRFGGA